jgi:hypothetical protein
MTIWNRRWILVSASIIFILLVFVAIWYELTFYDRAYARLKRGTTKADVLKRFGKPGHIGDCGSTQSWDDGGSFMKLRFDP